MTEPKFYQRDLHGHNWVISLDQINDVRSNGRSRAVNPCTVGGSCTPEQITINWSPYSWQNSHWMIGEALFYESTLSKSQVLEVERWINEKYGIYNFIAQIRWVFPVYFFNIFCFFVAYTSAIPIKHYDGGAFIIVDGQQSGEKWKWRKGRKYCQTVLGTDYYSLNSFYRQSRVLELALENNIKSTAWIGLFRDGSEWKWSDGESTNDFFYWKLNDPSKNGTFYSMIRFDRFGGGWGDVPKNGRASSLICSNRWVFFST